MAVCFSCCWPALAQAPAPGTLPHSVQAQPAAPAKGIHADAHLDKTPPRQSQGLGLAKLGWSYNCMECHQSFTVKWQSDRARVEHRNIQLNHGSNRFCLTCHNAKNMNTFVDHDGSEIAEKNVVQLCAKCHGPTYRDWEGGAHGRRNGYWKSAQGPQTRLRCIQCHDPHDPKFKPMEALPGAGYPERAAGKARGDDPHADQERTP